MKKGSKCFIKLAGVLMVAALMGSCSSGMTMKAYQGDVLPRENAAIVESGAYTQIEAYDGRKVGSRYLNIALSPGEHTVEVAFVRRAIGSKLLYAHGTARVKFRAEPGHRYEVYANPVPASEWAGVVVMEYDWIVYVTDKTNGKRVAQSDPAPLKVEPLTPGFFYHNFP